MNRSGVMKALVLIILSFVVSFSSKVLLVGGFLGWSLSTFLAGLGLALLSPMLLLGGILYAVYSWFRSSNPGESPYGSRVFSPSDFEAYCQSCGRVTRKDGKFCWYCGRAQSA